jgi:hypothetical protein
VEPFHFIILSTILRMELLPKTSNPATDYCYLTNRLTELKCLAIPYFCPMFKRPQGNVSSSLLSKFGTHHCSLFLYQTVASVWQQGLCLWVYSCGLSLTSWEFHPLLVLSSSNGHRYLKLKSSYPYFGPSSWFWFWFHLKFLFRFHPPSNWISTWF